ncbi:hypothetical protein CA13_25170 [Planctomycetes bacterium CA13]|uniref:Uncharacterized protein n=1 Tax=Novipirellula herctigrandis TaxID=2527986 RepID=A0A5C5Z1L8_9BACT|nr:hypothetical protein CA13_25170 [Planctomycetes bacterium CA13]
MTPLEAQINKRLTLNLLIQGAAAHAFVSASHLVRDELERIRPGLTELYDRFAISGQLNYCIGDNALFFGRPNRWWGLSESSQKPLRNHRLLDKYGNQLVIEETAHLRTLAKTKNVIGVPFLHWLQFMPMVFQVLRVEKGHEHELTELAIKTVSEIWDIPQARLDGSLTRETAFGNLHTPKTALGRIARNGVLGYGGVELRGDRFFVVAKAWVYPLLVHELVKGTVELICLHGLNELDDATYDAVTREADQLEYEAWLLQAGPAMWRKFIAVTPRDISLAHTIMHVARLNPKPLEELMMQVIESPDHARDNLAELIRSKENAANEADEL